MKYYAGETDVEYSDLVKKIVMEVQSKSPGIVKTSNTFTPQKYGLNRFSIYMS